ncbi:hypothetical protein [Desulfomonile tiedjei]|uniref:Uncharacterized protein n=1 Tax=Desulfomonile tiedjei (strain ATCC 49306 / DSM 6799 / DCB-1) TaxID=706587 RepID=I4C6B3_DESTA|nr:hypothetical protein [Desulfomonile tiedjei]AFM25104.1 hypothetical protein Desti_2422 [Desulfomonile tiedjei DSM 6799]
MKIRIADKSINQLLKLYGTGLLAGLLLCFPLGFEAIAQTAHQTGPATRDQGVSHQMNQPPPSLGDRYDVSADRLDDIRELYLQARKEIEAKKDPKTLQKK